MIPQRRSWQVKDEDICLELLELIDITSEDCQLLRQLQDQARDATPDMVKDFYGRLFASDNTKEYLEGASMERLHLMISDWFVDLFSGRYDGAYARGRIHIGHIHVKIGLPVRYPLAMLDVVNNHGLAITAKGRQPEKAARSFRKILSLDIAIFNQAYEDNQLKHLAELVGGERLARILLSG